MKKKTIVITSVVIAVLLVAGALGTGVVLAANSSSYPPMVKKLADKLNVKEDDVQGAIDEMRTEKQKEMQKKFEERLDQAVKDGKITEEQKAEILKKQEAIQKKQEEMRELKQDLQNWATENNIDLREICGGFGRGGGCPPGGPGGGGFGPGPVD
jgi:TolA-binding protein